MAAASLFLVYIVWQAIRGRETVHQSEIGDIFFILADLLALASAVGAAVRTRTDRRRSRSWNLVAVGILGYVIGDALQAYQENIRHVADAPDWSDAVFYAFFFCGLIGFATTRRSSVRRWLFSLDTTIIALSAGALLWYLVAGPVAASRGHSTHEVVYAVIYPLGDLLLLLAAVRTLQRGVAPSSRRPVKVLAAGIVFYVISDTIVSYLGLHGGYHGGDRVDTLSLIASTLFTISSATQTKITDPEPASELRSTNSTALPYMAAFVAFTLLFLVQRHEPIFPELSISGIAVLVAVLVATSQLLGRKALVVEQERNGVLLDELHYRAFHDTLTGLANRALFYERLEHALERRRSPLSSHSVLMIDLDRFKSINDRLGHEAGDDLLRVVSDRLRSAVRSGDTVARIGGDEFAILLEDVDSSLAVGELVERLVGIIGQPALISGHLVHPGASVGIAMTTSESQSAEQLLRFADTAMYHAKLDASTHYSMFNIEMEMALTDRQELESDLGTAVAGGQLRVLYQPIVDLRTLQVDGFEALVRWQHPTRGLLLPDTFLPVAEASGLIHEIDTWVLHESCMEASRWPDYIEGGASLSVQVNLSPLELREPDLVESVSRALDDSGLPARCLTLELVESSVVDDLGLARTKLAELRSIGVRLAVDDFGTGFSSLSHLRTLPIDELKIDRSFIAAMGTSVQANALVSSVIQLASSLGIETVAEGIEDAEQVVRLLDEQCLLGQGYHFARPLDRSDVETYLQGTSVRSKALSVVACP